MPWAPDYVTAEQLADYARIQDEDDAVELAGAAAAASRAVDVSCGRQFGKIDAAESRLYTAELRRAGTGAAATWRWVAKVDDVHSAAGLVVELDLDGDGTYSHPTTDYQLRPANAAQRGRPWEYLLFGTQGPTPTGRPDLVRVTSPNFGWAAFPEVVVTATKVQGNRFFTRRLAPFGVAGSPESGTELRLLAKLDPDVELMLGSVRRRWGAR